MQFSDVFTIIGLLLTFIGMTINVYYANKKIRSSMEEENIRKAKNEQELYSTLQSLTTKDYLDSRLNQEIGQLDSNFKCRIDDLKCDMKEQINQLKTDIKIQQESIGEMSKSVVKAEKGAEYAHERINTTEKRIDDLKEFFIMSQQKKP